MNGYRQIVTPEQSAALLDLTHSNSIETLWDLHCRRMADFGFDRLLYGFTRFRTATSLGDPDDFIVLSNIDTAYVSTFINDGLYRSAPMVRWALGSVDVHLSQSIVAAIEMKAEKLVSVLQ